MSLSRHRGLYVKLAQALATQGPFLPPAYMKLAKLLDDAEHFDYEIVQDVRIYHQLQVLAFT